MKDGQKGNKVCLVRWLIKWVRSTSSGIVSTMLSGRIIEFSDKIHDLSSHRFLASAFLKSLLGVGHFACMFWI